MNTVAKIPTGEMIENVIAKGDLSKLTADERTQYYVQLCRSMGLNPHTQPFAFLTLNGKLTLYAKRDAADQLRKINGISIEIVERSIDDGLFTVHVRAKDANGRTDEDFGVVPMPDTLKGENRANQILKGITKAKRRVTLSISGLGFPDETEVEDISGPGGRLGAPTNAPATPQIAHDADGVVIENATEDTQRLIGHDQALADAAKLGTEALKAAWAAVPASDKPALKAALDRRHKPVALEADASRTKGDGLDLPEFLDRREKKDAENSYVDLVSAG